MLESMGISVEFSHHEGAPGQQEIDLRYADALSTADNIMTFRVVVKEVALEQGDLRLLHAQAVHRAPRLGHAHPPVAVRGRPQRVLRGRRRVPPVQGRPVVHRRPAPARGRDHRRDQPVGELLQAARSAAARRRRTSAGGTTTGRPWSGCRCTSRARASRPGSRCARSTPRATPTSPTRVLLAAGSRASRRTTSCPREAEDDVWSLTDAERRALGIAPLPHNLDEAIRVMERQRAGRRDARRARLRLLPAQQAGRVADYRRQVTAVRARPLLPVL